MKLLPAFILFIISVSELHSQRIATYNELDEINDVYFDRSTSEPFTGIIQDTTSNTGDFMRIHIENGIANGPFEGFYDEDRTVPKWKVQYVNGKKEGKYIHFFENGAVNFVVNMKSDRMHGKRHCYYEDGALMHIHHYRNDKEHGLTKTFYPEGQVIEKVHYKNGLKHGKFKKYHKNGKRKQTGSFKNDELNGTFKQYDESGKRVDVLRNT